MQNKLFIKAIPIIETLTANGYETYFVGGCVRDTLLNRQIKDIDIATAASPQIVMELFEKVIPVGVEHGTVIVRLHGESYEVTTFRKDGTYSDQRHPDEVVFVTSIKEDLQRRDFTINALAMTDTAEIIDLFAGKSDLDKRMIRTVGSAHDRFMEDPLRIVRALRFASELGFSIEVNTLREMFVLRREIEKLAIERLSSEFTKFFTGEFVQNGIDYLKETDISAHLPIMKQFPNILERLPKHMSAFKSFAEVIVLFHYYEPHINIDRWIKAWKCSNMIKKEALQLINTFHYYRQNGVDNWLVYCLDKQYFEQFIHLVTVINESDSLTRNQLKELKETLQISNRSDIAIDGNELQRLFPVAKPGPWMNELFVNVEKVIVMNELENDKKAIKEWITCHPPVIN